MKKSIFASFLTTTSKKQALLALLYLFQPWKRLYGKYLPDFRLAFARYMSPSLTDDSVFCFYNARSALYHGLLALGVKMGDYVVVQGYTCVSVINAIKATGAIPFYVDISLYDLNMSVYKLASAIEQNPLIKVVIVQHTFGLVASLEDICSLCQKHKIAIIEDCAHALGAVYHDKKVGLFGDIAVFSLGRDKVVSSVNGGVALVNNNAYIPYFSSLNLGSVSYLLVARNLLYAIFGYLSFARYDFFSSGKVLYYACAKLRLFPFVVSSQEKRCANRDLSLAMPNALAALAFHELVRVDEYNYHRREVAYYYKKLLGESVVVPIRSDVYDVYLRVVYCCRVNRDAVMNRMKQSSIYLGDWYQHVVAPSDVIFSAVDYKIGACPNAELLSGETLNLPNSFDTHIATVDRIVSYLN